MTDPAQTPAPDDQFAARIQAEVMAAAEQRRREDPRLARVEREVERAWADIAPVSYTHLMCRGTDPPTRGIVLSATMGVSES